MDKDLTPKKNEPSKPRGLMALFGSVAQQFTEGEGAVITDGLTEESVNEKGVVGSAVGLVKNMAAKSAFANTLMERFTNDELSRLANDDGLLQAINKYCDEYPLDKS